MRAKPITSVVLVLIVVAASLMFAGCGTPPTGESTTQSSVVSTTTEGTSGHWEEGGVSLTWPAGWRSTSVQETIRWPLGRLLESTLLLRLKQGDSYPLVELIRVESPPGDTLQSAFDEAYGMLGAEWGSSLRDVTGWTAMVGGLPALVKSYEIPNGEPYYKQQDVWMEFDGSLFVLAGRDGVSGFDENVLPDLEAITQSLRFGATD